jgi:hypothetical protein
MINEDEDGKEEEEKEEKDGGVLYKSFEVK